MGRQEQVPRKFSLELSTPCAGNAASEQRCGQAVCDRLNAAPPNEALREAVVKLLGDDVDADHRRHAGMELDFYLVLSNVADGPLGQTHFRFRNLVPLIG